MKLFHFIPAILTLCMVLGILFGFYVEPDVILVYLFLGCSLALLLVSYFISNKLYKQPFHFNFLTYVLFFVIGLASVSFQNQQLKKEHYSHFIKPQNQLILTIEKELKANNYYYKYETTISQLNNKKVGGKILLNIKKDTINKKVSIDDIIYLKSNFKEIFKPLNLHQFNYRNYLEKQQIYHQISVSNSAIKLVNQRSFSLNGTSHRIRDTINNSLQKYNFKKDELAIINALLLGQRNFVSKELLQSYAGAGAMHILAVSGLHIGILLLLLNALFKPIERIKNGKTIKLFLVVSLLWLYALVAGFSPSIIRAVSMFTAIAFGMLSNKKTNTLHNLFISMFFLVLVHPLYIFSVGFQLSYLAVFSIVYFYPLFTRFYNPTHWFLKKVWQLLAISFAAQLGILPLSLYYFHQFPSLFFVSSLVIIPLLGFILGFGIFIIGLAIFGILPQFLADFYGFIIQEMNVFIRFISRQEDFLFQNISFSIFLLIASYFIIFFGFRYADKRSFKKLVWLMSFVIIFQGVLIFEKRDKQTKVEFVIFNQNRKSILGNKNGDKLTIYHNLDSIEIENNRALKDYRIGIGKTDIRYKTIKNSYTINDKKILIVDSLGIYAIPNFKPDIIILQQSPKINLKRLCAILQPEIIIADASNYKNHKKAWQQTCLQNNIIFWDTSKKGAYKLKGFTTN